MSAPVLPTTKAPNIWLSTWTAGSTLTAQAGRYNQLSADAGHVTLVGDPAGNNTFLVVDPTDKIVQAASAAPNTVITYGSGYALPANVQNISLYGTGKAYAIGNSGNNLINATYGTDTITTGGGNDVIVDGTGVDTTYITKQANTTTWIENFKTGGAAIDKLNLSTYFTSLSGVISASTQIGSDLQINLGSGQTVMLQNTKLSALTSSDVETGVDLTKMHMTFDEEFSTSTLSFGTASMNTGENNWQTTYAGGVRTLGGNNEQEWYVDPKYNNLGLDPYSVSNGVLTITASKTPTADLSKVNNFQYVSGMLSTQSSFTQQYGYFEARVETPAGQGLWPAFWLLPASEQWPPELDVMEQVDNVAGQNTTSYSTTHSQLVATNSTAVTMPEDLTAGFHTYGMNWDANDITYYIDGQQIAQMATPADAKQPMYMLLDLAVGGSWPGSPNATTDWSTAQMKVDYVRAYSTDATIPTVNHTGTGTTSTGTTAAPIVAGATGTISAATAASVVLSNMWDPEDLNAGFTADAGKASTSTTYSAAQMNISGVGNTSATVSYDANQNVTVTNNGAWNTVKNVTVRDSGASGVTVSNFVGVEVWLGTGSSNIDVTGVKRGDIVTQDGNSTINVTGGSNENANNGVNITSGNGNNAITFTGTGNDRATIKVGSGSNRITLGGQSSSSISMGVGRNDIVDNSTGTQTIALGTGSNVLEFLAGAHATVTNFNAAQDTIVLHGVSASQAKVTYSGGSTDISLGGNGSIHLAGVSLGGQTSVISYAS